MSVLALPFADLLRFAGIFALPQFALSEHMFTSAQQILNQTLRRTIARQVSRQIVGTPWSSSIDGTADNPYAPHCDIIVYLQQHPLNNPSAKAGLIHVLEDELRFPSGHRSMEPPLLTMSALIFSPDCGFVIESKGPPDYARSESNHLRGEKWEIYIRTGIDHSLLFAIVLALQILLTIAQMKHSSTPSTRSRISIYSIGMLSLGDGFIGIAFLPVGMLVDAAFPAMFTTAFFALLAVTFFDMRFVLDVWSVQAQEERRQERRAVASTPTPPTDEPANQATPAAVPIITAAGADSLPLPVTSRQAINSGASPINLPPDQGQPAQDTMQGQQPSEAEDTRRELGNLYVKFYLVLLGTTLLSLHATSWYPRLRSLFANTMAFIYLSFWWPQIYRNAMRNCRKALLWKFVVGQSVLRLAPIAYLYTDPGNVLWVANDRRTFLAMAGWVWVQIVLLLTQEFFGPRLLIAPGWAPPAYDYHPLLREDEEESRMPIGFTRSATDDSPQAKDKGRRVFDCAICMLDIDVAVVPAGAGGGDGGGGIGAGFLSRRAYMVTPCRHIFHTECLEAAMRYRLQCPICRETLPPL
jgi:hypothetical protein